MWTQNGGNVFWSDAAKLKLVGLLKRYPDAINGDRLNPKKHLAWKNIYDGLIKAGMPSTSVSRIKKCWSRIHLAAKAQHADQLKRFSNRGKLVPLSTLNQTIINLLNDVNSNIMPKPKVMVKQEPMDESAEEEQSRYNPPVNMNPVVRLNRIDADVKNVKSEPITTSPGTSSTYWSLMEKVAENEFNLKLAQRENEEERMERERELHQKNMILLDLKIKVQQMQIGTLQGQRFFE